MGWKLNHRRITNSHFSGVRTSSYAGLLIISEQGTQCKSFTSQSLAFITLASILPRTQHFDLHVNPEQSMCHFLLHHFTQVNTKDKICSICGFTLIQPFLSHTSTRPSICNAIFSSVIRSKFERSIFKRTDTE